MRILTSFLVLFLVSFYPLQSDLYGSDSKPRIIVLTDISNEPDDEESLVRFLVYSNEFDIEGLVATTSCWLRKGTRVDIIQNHLAAYSRVRVNLLKHASGYPPVEALLKVTCSGQQEFGLDATGAGKSTDGSRLIISAARKDDNRPLWILAWGGTNTLAQALKDAKNELPPADLADLISRLRVYTISDQDDAGPWIRKEFPGLFYIVDPSNPDNQSYFSSVWNGISGDRENKTGGNFHFYMVDNPWLEQNIINGHGPLGTCYPRLKYLMEGDTPSFLGLINNGLGWHERPDFGGWGGRYKLYKPYGESRPIWTSNRENRDAVSLEDGRVVVSNTATIWRWREHYQNDFAARMDWCIAGEYKEANHNPVVVLNGDKTTSVINIKAKNGEKVRLTSEGTTDPDGNELLLFWWIYPEAGTVSGAVLTGGNGTDTYVDLSGVKQSGTLHVILQVNDSGTPSLYSYRRAVIEVE